MFYDLVYLLLKMKNWTLFLIVVFKMNQIKVYYQRILTGFSSELFVKISRNF